jgi:Icc-related predicted phosphoesterase
MKIVHVSDTHGSLWQPGVDGDVVVHSGDMMPNRTRGIRHIEETYQENWTQQNLVRLKRVIGDRPFLYVPGNHDYFDPVPMMCDAGIVARNLTHEVIPYCDVNFLGFQYVPYFTGEWNFEANMTEMERRFDPIYGAVDAGLIDVLVCHSPIHGFRDQNAYGERCGSKVIRNALMKCPELPRAYLHGHIHESNGFQDWNGMHISNAATIVRQVVLR